MTGPEQSLAGDAAIPKIAPATLIETDGELIGVVGATTQVLEQISSPGDTTEITGGANDMAALAAVLQPVVDDLIAAGSNKIVLVSHLQQFALEQELAQLLRGVDIIVAGGSDTIVADGQDVLRPGDEAGVEGYPFLTTDADGNRESVRTEETNFGNITADANLAEARKADATTVISLKNGGGIRAPIGEVDADGNLLPPQANPLSGKLEGHVSQLDIENSLRFNNSLALITVTAEQLLQVVEHAVAETADGATPGQFAQIGGFQFSFDDDLPVGERVHSLAITDEAGEIVDLVVANGEVVGDPSRTFRMVTLSFLAEGGDGYPFPDFVAADPDLANVVELTEVLTETGAADFAAAGTEQDALAEFLAAHHGIGAGTPFDETETAPFEDERIQNLDAREDGIVADLVIEGSNGRDRLTGTGDADIIAGLGGADRIAAGAGNDSVEGGDGDDRIDGQGGDDFIEGGDGDDRITGGSGNDSVSGWDGDDRIDGKAGEDILGGGGGRDRIAGGEGNDVVEGGANSDQLSGDGGSDTLDGGDNNDRLDGGAGDDLLYGGDNEDIFVFTDGTGVDMVRDFELEIGDGPGDRIDVSDFGFLDFEALTEVIQSKAHRDALIQLDDDAIVLLGIRPFQLEADHFIF